MIVYGIVEDSRGYFDVIRWDHDKKSSIVQTNIPTLEKAEEAALIWWQREKEKSHERD